jgi:tetraacyldisaccharide-1-P 4'-kinase
MKLFFDDHHSYSPEDIRKLLELKQKHSAGGFITTEKDAMNLLEFASELVPLEVASVRMMLEHPDDVLDSLLGSIGILKQAL